MVLVPPSFFSFYQFSTSIRQVVVHSEKTRLNEIDKALASGELKDINYRLDKMYFGKKGGIVKSKTKRVDDKSSIQYNAQISLTDIPEKAYQYVVNGKSAIEWILERYQVKTDPKSGITNDPNDWATEVGNEKYILDLLLSVINVSLQTVDIVAGLPKLHFDTESATNMEAVFAQGAALITQQYGTESKWQKLSESLFGLIQEKDCTDLYLDDFMQLAQKNQLELDDVLGIIGLLSMPEKPLIKQAFIHKKSKQAVAPEEVYQKMRQYWRDKSLTEAEWEAWAKQVEVKWKVQTQKAN